MSLPIFFQLAIGMGMSPTGFRGVACFSKEGLLVFGPTIIALTFCCLSFFYGRPRKLLLFLYPVVFISLFELSVVLFPDFVGKGIFMPLMEMFFCH